MTRHVSQFLLVVSSLALAGAIAHGQTNLSAKANNLQPAPSGGEESDRARDGLRGPVRRIRTEVVKVMMVDGKLADNGKRVLLETSEYDLKGAKIQNQYFPVGGSTPTGRETYKYDDKGNISEMTLMGTDGSLISKETYNYDYDSLGNWVKMTSSVAVVENGRISFEPSEVTYRTIFYYLDASMTRMLEAPNSASANPKPESTIPGSEVKNSSAGSMSGSSVRLVQAFQPPPTRLVKFTNSSQQSFIPDRSVQLVPNQKVSVSDNDPAPAPKAAPLPVSNGVLNGQALSLPAPTYPESARRMQLVGTVRVEVTVDENGKVISAKAISGPGLLRDASIQAAYRAKFSPTKLSGKPVQVTGSIIYNFTATR
jgi:TonB family protein